MATNKENDSKEKKRRPSRADRLQASLGRTQERLRVAEERAVKAEKRILELEEDLKKAIGDSLTDALTGIPNRLAYERRLQDEFNRSRRIKNPLAILLFDVDHFKEYNKAFGLIGGDKVLVGIGQFIKKNLLRTSDFCARIGGDEFALILPNTSRDQAVAFANRLSTDLKKEKLVSTERPGRPIISGSFGVAELSLEQGSVPDEDLVTFVKRADVDLSRWKEHQRPSLREFWGLE